MDLWEEAVGRANLVGVPGAIAGAPHGVQVSFFISVYCTIEYCIWHHPDEQPETVKEEFETYIHHSLTNGCGTIPLLARLEGELARLCSA